MSPKHPAGAAAPADPCCFVIFGASGDLTHRLLLPALYNLAAADLLPRAFSIIGIARGEMSNDAFRDDIARSLRRFALRHVEQGTVDRLLAGVSYVSGTADDPGTYERLARELARVEQSRHTRGNRIFYLATPPAAFVPIAKQLGQSGLAREENGAWRRVVVEKPFGTDLASAQALNRELLARLEERQIYRIDHYLGKETVQNILVLRFANGLFEPIWNRDHIDHVQITVAETLTVGRRGRFYDATGALRDMVPNHLFQLLVAGGDGAAGALRCRCGPLGKGASRSTRCICRKRASRCRTRCARNMWRRGLATTRSRIIAIRPTCGATAPPRPMWRSS